jgi:hypothetical protein
MAFAKRTGWSMMIGLVSRYWQRRRHFASDAAYVVVL